MAVKGVFASDQNIVGTRKGDFAGALLQTMPTGSAPLLALSSGMKSAPAADTVITWFEENHLSGRAQVTASGTVNSTATSLAVQDASFIVAGGIFLVEASGEHIFVTSVTGTTLTITRGFAGSTAATINNSAFLQKLTTVYEEGSAKPTSVANLGFPRFNYMQIFRNAWDVTGTARAVEYHTGDIVAKNRRDAAMQHAEDIEKGVLFGRKLLTTQNSKPMRTMDGIVTQITTNVTALGATTKYKEIDDFLKDVFSKNIKGAPNERIAFCGNTALSVINLISLETAVINITPTTTEFGLNVNRWISPYGTISLMTHPLLVENATWTKDLHLFHPSAIRMRWLRATHEDDYDEDGTRAGTDADFGVITSELSVEYRAELTGGRLTGFTAADTTQPQ